MPATPLNNGKIHLRTPHLITSVKDHYLNIEIMEGVYGTGAEEQRMRTNAPRIPRKRRACVIFNNKAIKSNLSPTRCLLCRTQEAAGPLSFLSNNGELSVWGCEMNFDAAFAISVGSVIKEIVK